MNRQQILDAIESLDDKQLELIYNYGMKILVENLTKDMVNYLNKIDTLPKGQTNEQG